MTHITIDLLDSEVEDVVENGSIDIDIEDYIDEIPTDELIFELKKRSKHDPALLSAFELYESNEKSKTPLRDAIINLLDLHLTATVEDIDERIKEIYNK